MNTQKAQYLKQAINFRPFSTSEPLFVFFFNPENRLKVVQIRKEINSRGKAKKNQVLGYY